LLRQIRKSPALWLSPVVLLLVVLNTKQAMSLYVEPYWLQASAIASGAVIILAPACAALAAWEAGRHRRGLIDQWAPARTPVGVATSALVPVWLLAVTGFTTATAVVLPATTGVPGSFDLRLIGVAGLVVVAFTAVGWVAGTVARPAYVVPAMLVGVLLWLVYPPAMDTFWVRHLTGNFQHSCCGIETVIDAHALTAPALVAAALLTAATMTMTAWRSRNRWPLIAGVAVLIAGFVTAQTLVRDLGPDPVRPRVDGLSCRDSSGGLRVCVWVEHRDDLARAMRELTPAVHRLTDAGVPAPARLTEAAPAPDRGVWTFTIRHDMTPQDVMYSLAVGLAPPSPACAEDGPWPGAAASVMIVVWFARTAGVPSDHPSLRMEPELVVSVDKLRTRPLDVQRRWLAANYAAAARCDRQPVRAG
jgi:hypothetical protein